MEQKPREIQRRTCACRRRNPFLKKPMTVVTAEEVSDRLERRLGLMDLLAIGVGGTVGSGVFVLAGAIANSEELPAGPAVTASFLAAGVGCIFSGLSFAELASCIPSAGSTYAYSYVTLGEVFAFVAGWCLTLEYGLSSAAVARTWGDKLVGWFHHLGVTLWQPNISALGGIVSVNIYAGIVQVACVLLLLRGMSVGKVAVDFFTVAKLLLVAFMTVAGFVLYKADNMRPFAPSGVRGVFRGSMNIFFGYLGYDEVCCLGAETKNPHKNIPRAVIGTISGVTVIYVLASWALVGMVPYDEISRSSGFSEAFRSRGVRWAAEVVAAGELLTLPLVVLVSILAQPRLQYAMAEDGLLPKVFSRLDESGNLFMGTLICGVLCTVVSIFVSFSFLDDMISAGLLIAFNLTNSGLIISRRHDPRRPALTSWLVLAFNVLALSASFAWVRLQGKGWLAFQVLITLASVAPIAVVHILCPDQHHQFDGFRTPFVPWFPAVGAAFNWFLLAQLSPLGLQLIMAYVALALATYGLYGCRNSVGANTGWREVLAAASRKGSLDHENDDMAISLLSPVAAGDIQTSEVKAAETCSPST